ncbi:MAG: flagellin FliC, partial [Nitrospina sp.]|nr:flagellin FliC [Nitrospina sp.]
MALRIFNNIASINAQRILGTNNDRLAKSVERISSGLRINRGADDAAGL